MNIISKAQAAILSILLSFSAVTSGCNDNSPPPKKALGLDLSMPVVTCLTVQGKFKSDLDSVMHDYKELLKSAPKAKGELRFFIKDDSEIKKVKTRKNIITIDPKNISEDQMQMLIAHISELKKCFQSDQPNSENAAKSLELLERIIILNKIGSLFHLYEKKNQENLPAPGI